MPTDPPNYLEKAKSFCRSVEFWERPVAEDWLRVEMELGLSLPQSYKSLVTTFGSGCFGVDIDLYNPIASGLTRLSKKVLTDFRVEYRGLLNALQTKLWRQLYPEKGGLVLFANTCTRVAFFLQVNSQQERIVVLDMSGMNRQEYAMGAPELFCRLYEGKLDEWGSLFRTSQWPLGTEFFTPYPTILE
jgi:hypothetical protein